MNILLVDDNRDIRKALKEILELEGYDVKDASNGLEALKICEGASPDMIISDILMPGMDGFKLCHTIKHDRTLRKIPFIFYTANYTDPKDEQLARAMGASRFIIKPVMPDKFLDIIKDVIKEHRDTELHVPRMPLEEDIDLFRMYNKSLSRMLNKKLKDLEKIQRSLAEKEKNLREVEARYRTLLETANDAIFITDAETGIIIEANMQAGKLLGMAVENIIGLHQTQLHPQEEADRYDQIFRQHIEKKGALTGELAVLHSSGHTIPVEISTSVADIKGKKIVLGIFRDISEHKNTESALREERDMIKTYLDIAGVMIVALDTAGAVTLVNQKGSRILGCPEEDIIGKNWFETFLPERFKDDVYRVFRTLVQKDIAPVEHYTNAVLTGQGQERTISFHNTVLKTRSGDIKGILFSGEDITDRLRIERELKEKVDDLERFYEMAVGRELKMKELKQEIQRLKSENPEGSSRGAPSGQRK